MDFRLLAVAGLVSSAFAQPSGLPRQIASIAADAQGKVSVACSLPGTVLNCDLDPAAKPPMQSVFKLPLVLTALHLVEQKKLSLDQPIRFRPEDRILPHTYSPLQDKYPKGGVDIPLRELLHLSVEFSDNTATDIILRVTGGPAAVDKYVKTLGIAGFHIEDSEAALHHDETKQYRNWFQPAAAVQLLRRLADNSPLNPEHTALVLMWMRDSTRTSGRIKGSLPAGVVSMHKSGSSGMDNGLAPATNDIGLIVLPDGRYLAIAVFVTDSKADDATRDSVIARIAKAAYDAATR
jgi:beta-lactamase class A